jgi:hypothetical protein
MWDAVANTYCYSNCHCDCNGYIHGHSHSHSYRDTCVNGETDANGET